MSVISEMARVTTGATPTTIYTATDPCTLSLDITNDTEEDVYIRLVYTPDAADESVGHVMESSSILTRRAVFARNGMPVKQGWSFVVTATGDKINLSALVSGFTVEV